MPPSVPRKLLFLLFLFGAGLLATEAASAQSTLASISGSVRDSTDAAIPGVTITLHRIESNTDRTATSSADGSYTALNLDPGTYNLRFALPGFATQDNTGVHLDARQQLQLDRTLSPAAVAQTVEVDASNVGAIVTDNASISSALSARDVVDLPANYRGAGSTSPLNVIQALPGVQPDSSSYPQAAAASPSPSIKFSIQGGLPSQSETTVDGISAQNQTTNNIQADAFPSAESIAEIRVDGVSNNAEYGQPGEITTITKAGTNHLHGSLFWYFQNQAFDAVPFGFTSKIHKVANDYGISAGGPVYLPHLYNGQGKTFFFATFEGLRFPQRSLVHDLVPTVLEKQGDFSQETSTLNNPFTGQPYAGAKLPSINPSSAVFLSLFPDPNLDPQQSVQATLADPNHPGYNYSTTRRNDINSNQYDLRGDQNFGQRGTAFARYTNKNINQVQPGQLALPDGSAFTTYRIFATSFNYAVTPHLANEFRFGFTLESDGFSSGFQGNALTNSAGFNGISRSVPFNGIPYFGFQQLTPLGMRLNQSQQSRIFQYVDNITWQKGAHTIRFGTDLRHLAAITPLSFAPSDNFGNYTFIRAGGFTGEEFADFLLGTPNLTQTDNVQSNNNGTANAYAVYVQDNWKATPRLNLTFGLRYEFHPAFATSQNAIGNFDPSVAKSGRIIYNAGQAAQLDPQELANVNACATTGVNNPFAHNLALNGAPCTPVLSNTEAGLPAGLRHAPLLRFEPRFGFAFRPFDNERTAIRGGVGFYNITTTGALFYALTGTVSANLQTFHNSETANGPAFVYPNVSPAGNNFVPTPGSVQFYSAIDINWHDPYSLQTNLSIDHDFGHGFGLRVSYIGLKTTHLIWQPELNQLHYSNTTAATDQPLSAFPFPNFSSIPDRSTSAGAIYHSGQAELTHRFSRGLSFSTAYTFAKNLSDNQGTYGAFGTNQSFSDEQGGYNGTYTYDRHLDYGNVTGTRRHRALTSGVFELPVGQGRRFGGSMGRAPNLLLGGWQVSSIFLYQTGPFLTPIIPSGTADPSGTGSGTLFFRQQRPDRVANGNTSQRTRSHFFNQNAFACPGGVGNGGTTGFASLQNGNCTVGVDQNGVKVAPIGRFGTASVGDLVGPGTVSLSTGVAKSFKITESARLRAEGTFTNVLNHTNLSDPNLDTTSAAFGAITQSRGSDFGGNRTGQVSMKLEF